MRLIASIAIAGTLVLAGCSEPEVILSGERIPVRAGNAGGIGVLDAASGENAGRAGIPALSLPPPRRLPDWTMRVGNLTNDPGHATLSPAPARVWSADIGAGSALRRRITADPVSDGSRIFTLDALASISATSVTGATLWSRSLVPGSERAGEASGGGLAAVGGVVYVSTGFGELHALDAATGRTFWIQRVDAPITTPKVADGIVYLVSRDGRAFALDASDGRIRWEVATAPAATVMATAPAPAVTARTVIFPFGSGDLVATLRESGLRVWGTSISGVRRGVAYNEVGDITGDPVVSDGVVYAGTSAGRIIAVAAASGERLWTTNDGAVSPMVVAGGSVFAVSDRAQLLRIDARTGDVIWRQDLPFYRNTRVSRREGIHAHYGPVLAGGRLWVASSDGVLRGFDPTTGVAVAQAEIPGGAASRPIAFGDALYVTGRDGELHAFR
ncbi:outer membrane protein assembly factor BamB family protein [Jannaschia seosinensis]|nr:PQQ-binding-like beta-propeller repeat protein [Jannaschia seosinensis]